MFITGLIVQTRSKLIFALIARKLSEVSVITRILTRLKIDIHGIHKLWNLWFLRWSWDLKQNIGVFSLTPWKKKREFCLPYVSQERGWGNFSRALWVQWIDVENFTIFKSEMLFEVKSLRFDLEEKLRIFFSNSVETMDMEWTMEHIVN